MISGTGGSGITKLGDGTLILGGSNTFDGLVQASQGVIRVTNSSGLGATTGGTVVGTGAALHVSGNINVPENIVINNVGIGFEIDTLGAIRGVGGNPTLSGTISLGTNSAFGVDAGSTLTVSGTIAAVPGTTDNGFTKYGAGTLVLSGTTDNPVTGQVTVLGGTLELGKTGGAQPFYGALVIGDNRNVGSPGSPQAQVRLTAPNQLPELNFFRTGVNTITINSNGLLNLNNQTDTVGNLVMVTGRSVSAQLTTGSGQVILTGDITVNPAADSSAAGPPARISGTLQLGPFFSGAGGVAGGVAQHTITVNDTAVPNVAADLVIDAAITGAADIPLTKSGGGTLRLAGNNSYSGITRITGGVVEIASPTAFGNSQLVAIAGTASLKATNSAGAAAARTVDRPLSIDATLQILGTGSLTFTGPATLTGTRTIIVVDPAQTTTFTGSLGESVLTGGLGFGLTKQGMGTLVLAGPVNYTGQTVIGSTTAPGGTLRLEGSAALPMTLAGNQPLTISQGARLVLDNRTTVVQDRLPDTLPITLTGGTIQVLGNGFTIETETLGPITLTGNWSNTLQADGAIVTLMGLTRFGGATINFAGGATRALDATGGTQIRFSGTLNSPGQAGTPLPALSNSILPWATITGPGGLDFATYTSTDAGLAITPLPPSAYVTSFDAVPDGSTNALVKLARSESIGSRTVFAVLLSKQRPADPAITLSGTDPAATLRVTSGLIGLGDSNNAITVGNLDIPTEATIYVAPGVSNARIASSISSTSTITKGGSGSLILSGASQFTGQLNLNEGVINVQNSMALGSPSGATVVNLGAQLQLQGGLNILGEPITLIGTGPGNGTGAGDGALLVVSGNPRLASLPNPNNVLTISGAANLDGTTLFPNSGLGLFTGSAINVAAEASFDVSGIVAGGNDFIKLGGGTLQFSGALANTATGTLRIKQGEVFMNKNAGVNAWASSNATFLVGDDVSGTATLRLGANNQMLPVTPNSLLVASNGTVNFNNRDQALTNLALTVGPLGGSQVQLGSGTLTLGGNVTVQALGGGNPSGAAISGGTLALASYLTSAAVTRNFTVHDGASGADLTISAAIVNGSGTPSVSGVYPSHGLTKLGFGDLQFDGATPNTYSGITTVNDGGLLLNKSGGAVALSGPLVIGDGNTIAGGTRGSDVVRLLADNQLPDFQAPITINSTGLLDLNNRSDTVGNADGQTALTITSGLVQTGTGTLTVNGNLSLAAGFPFSGSTGTPTAVAPPQISGNLAFPGTFERVINLADRGELLVDGVITATLSGAGDVRVTGSGALMLTGNNSGLSAGMFVQNTGGSNNQPSVIAGHDNALGSGTLLPTLGVRLAAHGGTRTIANRVITRGFDLAAGNDLVITGSVDLLSSATITVQGQNTLTLAGGIGELTPGLGLTKNGPGTLVIGGAGTISGAVTINQGTVILRGQGTLANVTGITIARGATLVLDNSAATALGVAGAALSDRIKDTAGITLNGGNLTIIGSNSAVDEYVGTLNTGVGVTSSVTSIAGSAPVSLTFTSLSRGANSFLQFYGLGQDLGTENNRIVFVTNPALSGGILPYAAVAKQGDLDFATYHAALGVRALPVTPNTFTPGGNVKLTASTNIPGSVSTINALLISGNNITMGGSTALTISQGVILARGTGNTISSTGTITLSGVPILYAPDFPASTSATALSISSVLAGSAAIDKLGQGRITLAGNNTFSGALNIREGAIRAAHNNALGTTAGATVVSLGAALEASGGITSAEPLTLSGGGLGMAAPAVPSGNTGALRSVAGNNTFSGNVTLSAAGTGLGGVGVGADAGSTLVLSGVISGTVGLTKLGPGTVEFAGSGANTFTGGVNINEGTLRLNKTVANRAIALQAINIGDRVGAGADLLTYSSATVEQIADGATINVRGTGVLDLAGRSEIVIGAVTLESGLTGAARITNTNTTSASTLTVANNITLSAEGGTLGNLAPVVVGPATGGTLNLALQTAGGISATRTYTVNNAIAEVDMQLSAALVDGSTNAQSFTKAGAGRLDLAPATASTLAGTITVSAGIARVSNNNSPLGTAAGRTVVSSGATLELANGVTLGETLNTIAGTGFGGRGAVVVPAGATATVTGTVTLGAATTIGVDTGGQLNLDGALTGNQPLTKLLPGTLRYGGSAANTNAGTTTIAEGTLRLAKTTANAAVPSGATIVVGNGLGGAGADVLILGDTGVTVEQIDNTAAVTVEAGGLFNLNNIAETIGRLNFNVGLAAQGRITSSTLTIGGTVTVANSGAGAGAGGQAVYTAAPLALIESNLNLGGPGGSSMWARRAWLRTSCRSMAW